jgi:hypothetical protein
MPFRQVGTSGQCNRSHAYHPPRRPCLPSRRKLAARASVKCYLKENPFFLSK